MLRLAWEVLKAIGQVFAALAILMLGVWALILALALGSWAFGSESLTWGDFKDFAIYLALSLVAVALIAAVVSPIGVVGDRRKARRLSRRPLERPWAIATAPDGTTFIGEPGRKRLTRLGKDGLVELSASLLGYGPISPYAVAATDDGALYVADPLQGLVLQVPVEGGESSPVPFAPANEAGAEQRPVALALEHDGCLLVADVARRRLTRVNKETVHLVAECPGAVRGIAVLPDGRVAVSDKFGNRVWALEGSGECVAVAGTGQRGRSFDGRPACASKLAAPAGLAAAPDGRLFIADTANHRVVVVDRDGTLSTAAGTGECGFDGDGAAARDASLSSPRGLAFSGGALLIADTGNHRIRAVDANGRIRTVVGSSGGEAVGGAEQRRAAAPRMADGK